MMDRLLVAGDTHGDTGHLRHLIAVAKRHSCAAVFVLGDFGYWEHELSGVKFLDHIDRHAAREKMAVYFLDGNHDKTSLLVSRYGHQADSEGFLRVRDHVRYAPRGHRWMWGATRFAAFGGAYSVDKDWRLAQEKQARRAGWLWFPEEEMSDEDMARFLVDGSPVDVILAHDKPRASNPNWNRKDFSECLPNQDRLQMAVMALRPSLFLHGHLHYRYTDNIRVDSDTWCRVEAFTPNPDAHEPGYRREDSRAVLDLYTRRVQEVP